MSKSKVTWLNQNDADFEASFEALLHAKREVSVDVNDAVAKILSDIAEQGDIALKRYTEKFDRLNFSNVTLRISQDEIAQALSQCAEDSLAALRVAAERIEAYHRRQMPEDDQFTDEQGVELGHRWTAIQAVGLYVPGGTAAYPSSVLMNAIPAKVAGVKRLVMVVPTPDGAMNSLVLAAANIAGVTEIYRVGGAQAVGALAYGTDTIQPVDKIVGPGNAYVAAAKRQVFGTVGIDMIAGPSEILVVADSGNDPAWVAADLLSQAEHDESAQSILITNDASFAKAVCEVVEGHLATLQRADIARASWEDFGAVIIVNTLEDAVPLIDRLAPEHLEIATEDPDRLGRRITNAGAMFLGRYTPEAIGDYVAGTNHVLPTARSARYASGLSTLDFLKRTSLVKCDADSLAAIGPAAITLAEEEGLGAHGLSVSIRLNR